MAGRNRDRIRHAQGNVSGERVGAPTLVGASERDAPDNAVTDDLRRDSLVGAVIAEQSLGSAVERTCQPQRDVDRRRRAASLDCVHALTAQARGFRERGLG